MRSSWPEASTRSCSRWRVSFFLVAFVLLLVMAEPMSNRHAVDNLNDFAIRNGAKDGTAGTNRAPRARSYGAFPAWSTAALKAFITRSKAWRRAQALSSGEPARLAVDRPASSVSRTRPQALSSPTSFSDAFW